MQNIREKKLTGTRAAVYTAFFVAILVVLSQISVPLPFSPVPFTLGLLAVLLCGCFLDWGLSLAALAVYILMGLIGLPVFAGFNSAAALLGPTGGYIIGYLPTAFCAGLATKLVKKKTLFFVCLALSVLPCYAVGTIWYSVYADVSFAAALALCVVPFILFDMVKVALAGVLFLRIKRVRI